MIDQYLGAIYGKSSTIPPSHSKKVAPRTPSSCPRGRIQPPHSAGFPCSPLKDKDESLPFNHQKYPHKRGNVFQPYTSLTDIQSRAQKKGECFKDLYIRDLVIAGRMKWRGKFHNVETSHFQEEWVTRGLELDHDKCHEPSFLSPIFFLLIKPLILTFLSPVTDRRKTFH